jgi:Tol biopolymer transport system component
MLDDLRTFVDVRFSKDGRKLALHISDQDDDIWVLDVTRRVLNRVTFVAGEDETPAWSPDGTELAFASTRQGDQARQIRIARADGTGNERVVWSYQGHAHVTDWSPDGRWLVVEAVTPTRGLYLVDLKDPRTAAKLFQQTSFSQSSARVSPNGQRIAYMSNESGRNEIYAESFPQAGNKVRVSTHGGITPIWSHDGTRLFYRSETHVMAVAVRQKPELAFSAPEPLIADDYGRPLGETHTSFDVTPDGHFVFTRSVSPGASSKPRVLGVLNWAHGQR